MIITSQQFGMYLTLVCAYALLGWALVEIVTRSWGRPERLDASWLWTRPAPVRADRPYGPLRPPAVRARGRELVMEFVGEPVMPTPRAIAARGESFWTGEGATEDWSPLAEHAAADARRLPLDDVDEWLAARLHAYDHALARIQATSEREADEEMASFQAGSMALHEYRSMILDSSREFTMREHMQLEAMLKA